MTIVDTLGLVGLVVGIVAVIFYFKRYKYMEEFLKEKAYAEQFENWRKQKIRDRIKERLQKQLELEKYDE